ncbi:MAG: hypothetical protein ACK4TR_08890 [Phenylobacterium sp.]|uniref:hypothetical protein n=1 Tax=Phenylobacterium sp. TaxID=1871053 RepID=UPI00391B532E
MIRYLDLREVDGGTLLGYLGHLAENLRPSDVDELSATVGTPAMQALVESVIASQRAWIILADEEPVCIFGAADTEHPGAGCVWMMGTPRMDERAVALSICRSFHAYLAELHQLWPLLFNFIDARNQKSMRWLAWGGFQIIEALPRFGREGRLFFTFTRYDPQCAPLSSQP